MIRIYSNGEKITYTAGDTFIINVTSADSFDEGSKILFKISKSETEPCIIDKSISLSGSGFEITLNEMETGVLTLGDYIYKLVLISPTEEVITQKSGEFIVKWGA